MILNALLFLAFIITFSLGLFIIYKSPKYSINYFLALAIFGIAFWQLSIFLLPIQITVWAQVAFLGPTVAAWAMTIFLLRYPQKKFELTKFHYIALTIPSLFFLISLFLFPTGIISSISSDFTITQIALLNFEIRYGPLFVWYVAFIAVHAVIILLILIHNIVTYKGINQLRSIYLFLGFSISIFLSFSSNLLVPWMFHLDSTIQLGPLTIFFLVACLTYSIIKHRLFEIRIILRKSLIYVLLIIITFTFFTSIIFGLGRLFENTLQWNYLFTTILGSIFIAVFYPYLSEFLDRLTQSLFFKDYYDYQETLKTFSQKLTTTLELNLITDLLIQMLSKTLKVKHVGIFFHDEYDEFILHDGYNLKEEYPVFIHQDSYLVSHLAKQPAILIKDEIKFENESHHSDYLKNIIFELDELTSQVCVPIEHEGQIIALLLLGDKLSKDMFTTQDINLLETVRHHTVTALQNAKLYTSLQNNLENLSRVHTYTTTINQVLDTTHIASSFCKILSEMADFEKIAVMLFDSQKMLFYPFYGLNVQTDLLPSFSTEGLPFLEQTNLVELSEISDLNASFQLTCQTLKQQFQFENLIFIPLLKNRQILGGAFCSINAQCYRRLPAKNILISTLNETTVSALHNALLYTQILEMKNFNEEILENMVTGVITLDRDLKITSFNSKAQELMQIQLNDVRGQHISVLYPLTKKFKYFDVCFKVKQPIVQEALIRIQNKEIPISLSIDMLRDTTKNDIGVIGVISDLTPIKILQRQVDQTARLSSLGTMAAGVAHEIKNPLVAIKTFSELLPQMWFDPGYRKKYGEIVTPQINRINNLCQSLLKLGKPQPPSLTSFTINQVIQDILVLLDGERKKYDTTITIELDPESTILADKNQISQVLINILINAFQAMSSDPKDHTVKIKTQFIPSIGYVLLNIQDSGCGMSRESLNRLFDPYFSTKPSGNGLGLSIVHKIIQEHRGRILVDSELGVGTTFKIYLPTKAVSLDQMEEEELLLAEIAS